MSSLTPPTTPLYRVTLFFGPEACEQGVEAMQSVFNVKKRSWKAGVQVDVRLSTALLHQMKALAGFDGWLHTAWDAIPEPDRPDMQGRAEDAFAVALARVKLDDALDGGLPQENQILDVDDETDRARLTQAIHRDAPSIWASLRTELDLPEPRSA